MNEIDDISFQDAAHKNVILWKLMSRLNFWQVKVHHDINHKIMVMSIGMPSNHEIGHFSKKFYFDRLKCIDDKGNAHVYEFSFENAPYIWKVCKEFNFFPVATNRELIFARAELLDHLTKYF